MSLRESAKTFEIDKMTLLRYKNKKEKNPNPDSNLDVRMGYAKPRQILNDHLEEELTQYILICSKIYYGLTPKNIREIAYELALANQVKVPDTCITQKWLLQNGFLNF